MKFSKTALTPLLVIVYVLQSFTFNAQTAERSEAEKLRNLNVFENKEVKRYIKDSMDVLVKRCQWCLDAAYMAETYVGTHKDIPGWEGYPVKEYTYYTPNDVKTGRPKKGRVYLLMPSAQQLAYWVISACWKTKQSLDYEYTMRLLKFIRWQSGGQFAVRGVVYEAMYTKDYYEPYVFKDGVTVYVADPKYVATDEQLKECSEEQLEYCLNLTDEQLKPYTGRFARIASTSREMYYQWGGTEYVGLGDSRETRSLDYLRVVRDLYKKAWKSRDNELIDAWCYEYFVKSPEKLAEFGL